MSKEQVVLLLDGGMGHELKQRGISDGSFVAGVLANDQQQQQQQQQTESSPSSSSSSSRGSDIVESIHYDFLSAGCNVITTNSFVAVPPRMIECDLASDEESANEIAAELIRASVDRAKAAITRYQQQQDNNGGACTSMIAGCVPPLTECYFANKVPVVVDDLIPGYEVILSTLLDCNIDVLLAETLSTSREALAIVRALSSVRNTTRKTMIVPLWISFTVHDDRPMHLRSDELLDVVCQTIIRESNSLDIPLQAIGVNCSAPDAISAAIPILVKAVHGTSIKICAYGNCFQTTTSDWIRSLEDDTAEADGTTEEGKKKQISHYEDYDEEGYLLPIAYARYAKEWRDSGATILGGCCGCRPNHMREVAQILTNKSYLY